MRVSLVGLYSSRYPAIGETHALSVLASVLQAGLSARNLEIFLFDMVALSEESIDSLADFLCRSRPDILGLSVAYGTYSFLVREYDRIRSVVGPNCWIVLGGAIPTALPEQMLSTFPDSIVVLGEGERALQALAEQRMTSTSLDAPSIEGIAVNASGGYYTTPRRLVELATIPAPYRDHITSIAAAGGQIFTELSRGCSWSACRFCLRGLTDIAGSPKEYRYFPTARLRADLRTLHHHGVRHFTFADEDFLGTNLDHARRVTAAIEDATADLEPPLSFGASLMPRSVFARNMSAAEVAERRQLLIILKRAGMRKAFLGIESGSRSQLRRYAKSHDPIEAKAAIDILRSVGVSVEAGWIMFDPLCHIEELQENVSFLSDTALVEDASYIFAELRLQTKTRYLREIERSEVQHRRELYERWIDPDTLSHRYTYLHPEVARIVSEVGLWTLRLRPLHYPLKNLTRFDGSPLAGSADEARQILFRLRRKVFDAFQMLVLGPAEDLNATAAKAWEELELAADTAAKSLSGLLGAPSQYEHAAISHLASTARNWRLLSYADSSSAGNQ